MGTPDSSVENVEAIKDSMPEVSADASSVESVEMVLSVLADVVVGPRPLSLPSMHCSAIDHCK